jgi:D-beta-D-heptose 7-phosphate kinase / D-beta-D-heptose 1-phosphate adenosyltransferase
MYIKKLIQEEKLKSLSKSLKQLGSKVVFTNGCFDILHVGHVRYLHQARAKGDVLLVAVNGDSSISSIKGSMRPINSLQNRLEVLAALSCIDYLVSFDTKTPEFLLELLQPDILVKGGDYKNVNDIVGKDYVESYGGNVCLLEQVPGVSTTSLIEKMKSV